MTLYSALKKIFKRKKQKSYYNSDHILTVKERQSLVIGGVVSVFPIIIATIVLLSN